MSNIMPDYTPILSSFLELLKNTFGLNIQIKTETLLTYYTFWVKDVKLRVKDSLNVKTSAETLLTYYTFMVKDSLLPLNIYFCKGSKMYKKMF